MLTSRPFWIRTLRLAGGPAGLPGEDAEAAATGPERTWVHARSRFRSRRDPARTALYAVHDADDSPPLRALQSGDDEHTLVAVREFRRVPLEATALGLALFTARPGETAAVLATLAHFVERAVSRYQPAYVLLAHSREQPRLSFLLLGVDEVAALDTGIPEAFSLEAVPPDLRSRLAGPPEWFSYDPGARAVESVGALVSPFAV